MECYVDDMIVKSEDKTHTDDLRECFEIIYKHNRRVNPTKCTFNIRSWKFLRYLVSERGIEANPEPNQAIIDNKAPQTKRDVQKLTGQLVVLWCFISRCAEKSYPRSTHPRKQKNSNGRIVK